MDLWIRSQDKTKLVKADEVKIEREYIDFNDTEIFHINTAYDELAEYPTKERALEVLNEINNLLRNTITDSMLNTFKIFNGENHKVYEMPEE